SLGTPAPLSNWNIKCATTIIQCNNVMLVGDSGVGKTCLLVRFKDGAFLAGSFISTVGIDFRNKVMSIDAVKVKLQIWDTAGQERFRSVTHAYYRDANALLLLYDVTNKASFDNIRAWLTEIHEYAQQDVVVMLLGNKVDSTHDRMVKREEGEKLAKEFGVPFMETSAKSGLNVELAFTAHEGTHNGKAHKLSKAPCDENCTDPRSSIALVLYF
uniref:small monomeric GTPase n=1 Tax=Cyclopterus lumpus TaxID=8103 RepID=A0A8C3ATB6_CYCLU